MVHFFTTLHWFIEVCRNLCTHIFVKIQPQHFDQVEFWTQPTGSFILFIFRPSVVDVRLCLGSLFCWLTQFQPSFICQSDGLTFDSRKLRYTEEFIVPSVHFVLV